MPSYSIVRTDEELQAEIVKLKTCYATVPKEGMMGNNHDSIRASIRVLEKKMSHDEIFDAYGEESDPSTFDQAVLDGAVDAEKWMNGDRKESPSDLWNE